MHQIKPYGVWVGHAGDGLAYPEVLDKGIRAIVQVAAEEAPLQPPRELIFCRVPLLDGAQDDLDLLYLAIRCVEVLLRKEIPTLVCCSAGMSRSPAIVAAALALVLQVGLDECLKSVTDHHATDISPGFLRDVVESLNGGLGERESS
jgi:hypothetical protein